MTSVDIEANSRQAEYWGGAAGANWVRARARYDAELAQFADEVLRHAAIERGDRVLDVGCGTGALSVLAASVANAGDVTGIDISDTMLTEARRRAIDEGRSNVHFRQADAQVTPLEPSSVDVVISRFGVMFFADPVAAFTNIAGACRPGGRLCFVCWQAAPRNPWLVETAAAVEPLLGPMPIAEPGSPGPMGLADPDHTRGVLEHAGWHDVEIDDHCGSLLLGGPATLEEIIEFWSSRPNIAEPVAAGPPGLGDQVRTALREVMAPRHDGTGVRYDAAVWMVQARR